MLFTDRREAGRKLALLLDNYQNHKDVVVLGLPRGGVVVAHEISKSLNLFLDVICPRKIGAPFNPEFAIGAITETGQGIFNMSVIQRLGISDDYLRQEVEAEKKKAQHRLALFRKDLPPRDLKGKIIILVDDGLATGSTMKAAIQSVKAEGAKEIIVAVPVAPIETVEEIRQLVDKIVCPYTPSFFEAIGQFYEDFSQVDDEEVSKLLQAPD